MHSTLMTLALLPSLVAANPAAGLQHGNLLTYRGKVAAVSRDRTPGDAEKTFDLTLLISKPSKAAGEKSGAEEQGAQVYWLVEEQGRGNWPWPERFGTIDVDAAWEADPALGPALLYDHGETTTVIDLVLPMLVTDQPLAAEATWAKGPWTYLVQAAEKRQERDVWQVQVSNSYGPKRVLWVDQAGPQVLALTERVFMGMGDEYQLELEAVGVQQLEDDKFEALRGGFETLLALRSKLNRKQRSEDRNWAPDQLAVLEADLPAVEKSITSSPLAKLARAARRDLNLQSGRATAVQELTADHEGQAVAEFAAEGAGREALSSGDLEGKVTVLHFWEYRDAPLKEPYGQVGYLDFLYLRHKESALNVYGVAVDGRLAEEETRSAAVRSVRKLKMFMNLSYPILLDAGKLIKQFGDPREIGAELPLFVVIGPDAKILHYHVGTYEVDRNEGLKELNEVVSQALKERGAGNGN